MSRGKPNPKDDEFRGKTTVLLSDEPDHDDDIDDARPQGLPLLTDADASNLDAWFGDTNREVKISITRPASAHRGREEFVMRCVSGDFRPDELKEHLQLKYGGGDYRVRGYFQGKTVFNELWTVADLKPATPAAEPISKTADPVDVAMMLKTMQLQMLESQMNAQRQSAEVMSTMMNAIAQIAKPQPAPDPLQSMQMMFTMMASARDMFAPAQGAAPDPLGVIKTAMELAKEIGGGGGDKETNANDVLMSLLGVAGKALPQILAQNKNPPSPRPPAQPAIPRMNPAPQAPVSPVPAPTPVPAPAPRANPMQQAVEKIDAMRAMGAEPGQAADLISEALDDGDWLRLQNFLHREDWLSVLGRVVPGALAAPEWWRATRESLRAAVDDLTDNGETAKTTGEEPPEPAAHADATPRPVS